MGKLWGMLKLGTKLGLAGGTVYLSNQVRRLYFDWNLKLSSTVNTREQVDIFSNSTYTRA